jgi:hypothetical protein
MHAKNKIYFFFIPLLLVLGFGLRHAQSTPASDFAGYYYGGRALLSGHYEQAYDMQTLNDRIATDGYKRILVSYAPFPPFTSLVFSPFLLFPMGPAKIVFNVCSIGLFLFSLLRICRYFSTPPWLILVLPVIFFIPLLNNLAFGQSYLLLFVLLAEGYLAYREEKIVLSSTLWAIAILFKLFPAFLFLFLLLRRKYRNALYLGIACGLLLLPSLWLNGMTAWKFYGSVIVPKMGRGELNDSFTYVFQSAFMLLKRCFLSDGLLNPHPVLDNPYLFTLGMALFKAFILSTAALLTLREKDDSFAFSVWVMASMLISPNGSSYSLVLLLIPLLALVHRAAESQSAQTSSQLTSMPRYLTTAAILLLTAACAVTVSRFGAFPVWAQFPRLYLLLLFYGLLLMQGKRSWNVGLFSLLTLLFFVLEIRGNLPETDPSSYVLTKEQHLFICDFTARDKRLIYYYRDDSGEHEQATGIPVNTLTTDGVSLQDNQIWYKGSKLTDSPDRKEKAALVDGAYIVYLSDKHRGVDFFTLRKLRPDGAQSGLQQPDPKQPDPKQPDPKQPDAAAVPVSSR